MTENKAGKFDIHKAMLPLLPKKGLTLPDIDIVVLFHLLIKDLNIFSQLLMYLLSTHGQSQ